MAGKNRDRQSLHRVKRPELFIGLVAATGTDTTLVRTIIEEELSNLSYQTDTVRLSEEIATFAPVFSKIQVPTSPEDKRIWKAMDAGNALRRKLSEEAAVAYLGIKRIRRIRKNNQRKGRDPLAGSAYIISSLKLPAEVKSIRGIYGPLCFMVSVYSPRPERLDRLAATIALSQQSSNVDKYRGVADRLIERDANEAGDDFGQNLRDTFPLGDVFFRSGDKETLRKPIKRFIELIFGKPFITPTKDEQGMFLARAAALRSSDLSRQVGAAIATKSGEIVSLGCNDVPGPGGDVYWEDDDALVMDHRDHRLGRDTNTFMKSEILGEVFQLLRARRWFDTRHKNKPIDQLVNDALYVSKAPLKDTRVANIIEYGRIVHAEMAALMDAARRGISVKGCTLYCTTFPCHICARHILAAGVARVVFIEPYPKSMAVQLYKNSIRTEEQTTDPHAILFDPFVGISPRRYMEFFDMRPRKDKQGNVTVWNSDSIWPQFLGAQSPREDSGNFIPRSTFVDTNSYREVEDYVIDILGDVGVGRTR